MVCRGRLAGKPSRAPSRSAIGEPMSTGRDLLPGGASERDGCRLLGVHQRRQGFVPHEPLTREQSTRRSWSGRVTPRACSTCATTTRRMHPHTRIRRPTSAPPHLRYRSSGRETTTSSTPPGVRPYKRELPDVEVHTLDTGRFAPEMHGAANASRMRDLMAAELPAGTAGM